MKNTLPIYLLLTAFIIAFRLNAQVPSIQWQQSLGGTAIDFAQSIQQTADGGYIVAGQSGSLDGDVTGNHGNNDYWVAKLDTTGGIEWETSLGGTDNDLGNSIQQTSDGGYIVAGNCRSNDGDVTGNHGLNDYWIAKLDENGILSWQKSLGGTGVDEAHSIHQTSDGGYILAGISNSNDDDVSGNHGDFDYWVVKTTSDGSIDWQKSLGGSNYDEAFSAMETTDGGFIVAGASTSNNGNVSGNHGGLDFWIVKLDVDGNLVWQKALGGNADDGAAFAQQTTDGGYIAAGYSNSNNGNVSGNHGGGDYWIVKLDANGGITWKKCLGGGLLDIGTSVQQTTGGGFIVAGYSSSINGDVTGNHGSSDYWLVRVDNNGVLLWQKSLGGTNQETASCVRETADGGYVVTGSTNSSNGDVSANHGLEDYWVVKLSTDNATGIHEVADDMVSVFPNPASDQINIHIANQQAAKLTLFNILGEEVISQSVSASSENVLLDISGMSAGTYIVKLSSERKTLTAKFVKD